ncbi:MAG: helix-turn-helix domain-containing protein [Pseudomonadales bacterium]
MRALTELDARISTIAQNLGFSEQASFIRFVRRVTGLTPREVRPRGRLSE